jgi:serine/threonine protein kinase
MQTDTSAVLSEIQRLYADRTRDVDFANVLGFVDVEDDAALSELIEADGRHRLSLGEGVELGRYLAAIPDLAQRQDSLDAAIDVTLRSLSGGSRITPQAVDALVRQHPNLEEPIREAAMLNATIWSTTGFRSRMEPPPIKDLPCDFGPALHTGERRYQLQKFLGQGGFGQVYLAHDRQLSEKDHTATVAIKILATSTHSPWVRQRLIEEATKVRRISHPNVVMVIDRGLTEQNEDYIVYEYVDGGDLTVLAKEKKRLPIEDAVRLISKIARGVHAAHSAGVIHCDLKPSNIMLSAIGEPKVADFGVAIRIATDDRDAHDSDSVSPSRGSGSQLTASHAGPVGNVAFISPEQYRGEDDGLSVQSDIYALGGMLYLMLTGELPNGVTREEIARTHDSENGRKQPPSALAVRAEIDPDLDAICSRAMAVDPSKRYESAAAFAEDLDRWHRLEPIGWNQPSMFRKMRLWTRRKPALAAAVAGIVLVAMAGTIIALRLTAIANRNALHLALAQKEVEKQEALQQQRHLIGEELKKSLKISVGQYKFATDHLAFIWAVEYVYGPKVLAMPDEARELWKHRIENIRALVQTAYAEDRTEELETLLWESALGFWLVSGKDYQEAEPLLATNFEKWSKRLAPNDQWLLDVRAMQACAVANRYAALRKNQDAARPNDDALRAVQSTLLAACAQIPENRRGTPMHLLILNAMIDLCAPDMLNDPSRKQSIEESLKILINRKAAEKPCG